MLGQCLRLGEENDLVREKNRHRQQGRQRRIGKVLETQPILSRMWESLAGSFLVWQSADLKCIGRRNLAPCRWGKLHIQETGGWGKSPPVTPAERGNALHFGGGGLFAFVISAMQQRPIAATQIPSRRRSVALAEAKSGPNIT